MLPTFWTSSHLHLRALARDDLAPLCAMLKKESVCEHLFFGPNTEEETLAYFTPIVDGIEAAHASGETPGHHEFAMVHPGEGSFMGVCALQPIDYAPDNYLIGAQLDEPFWGQRFGTWAMRFLAYLAFHRLGARRITGDCMAANIRSARMMEGVGFRLEGRQREHWMKNGTPADNLLYGALRADADLEQLAKWGGAFAPGRPRGLTDGAPAI